MQLGRHLHHYNKVEHDTFTTYSIAVPLINGLHKLVMGDIRWYVEQYLWDNVDGNVFSLPHTAPWN